PCNGTRTSMLDRLRMRFHNGSTCCEGPINATPVSNGIADPGCCADGPALGAPPPAVFMPEGLPPGGLPPGAVPTMPPAGLPPGTLPGPTPLPPGAAAPLTPVPNGGAPLARPTPADPSSRGKVGCTRRTTRPVISFADGQPGRLSYGLTSPLNASHS